MPSWVLSQAAYRLHDVIFLLPLEKAGVQPAGYRAERQTSSCGRLLPYFKESVAERHLDDVKYGLESRSQCNCARRSRVVFSLNNSSGSPIPARKRGGKSLRCRDPGIASQRVGISRLMPWPHYVPNAGNVETERDTGGLVLLTSNVAETSGAVAAPAQPARRMWRALPPLSQMPLVFPVHWALRATCLPRSRT